MLVAHPQRLVRQVQQARLVETAGMAEVDVLEAGLLLQPGQRQTPRQGPALLPQPLRLDQHREAVREGQLRHLRVLQLLAEGLRHAAQPHRVQAFQGRLDQHAASSPSAPEPS